MSTFDAFVPLEDVAQVIYQGAHRFVLLSKVDYDSREPGWEVHLGLADEGRWWKGKWVEADVHDFIGSNVSTELLEMFAENIANTVVQGELFIGNWSTEKDANIKMIFGPTGKKPISVPLTEMSSEEAARFVTNEFFSLALNAQSRKCKLNPPAFAATTIAHPLPSLPAKRSRQHTPSPPPQTTSSKIETTTSRVKPKEDHIMTDSTKQTPHTLKEKSAEPPAATKPKPTTAVARKKARKVQQMEFGSDDE